MVYDGDAEGSQPSPSRTWQTLLKSSFRWPPCGAEVEKDEDQPKTGWLWRCCRRFKPTGDEGDVEAGGGGMSVGKSQSKISRGNSVSFASAPSTTSVNAEEFSHAVPFDPEEFLRPVHQSDLVDRFYSKLAAEYEAAATASASGLAEENLLPWRDSGAAFSVSPTTRSDAIAQSRSFGMGGESSYGHSRKASSAGNDTGGSGILMEPQDTEFSHFTSKYTDADGRSMKVHTEPEVHQLEHPERTMQRSGSQRSHRDSPDGSPRPSLGADSALASRSPPSVGRPSARPDRSSRSAPLISLEDLDMEQVESVIVTPTNQLKQKHLVFAMVQEEQPVFKSHLKSVHFVGVDANVAPEESPARNRLAASGAAGAGPLPPREAETSVSATGSDTLNGTVSGTGDPSVESNVQDVHIELEMEDKKDQRRNSGSSSRSAKSSPHMSDEEALAALEVAQWPPPKDAKPVDKAATSQPVATVTGRYVDEESPVTPLPSPPMAPATPATAVTPGASPQPSRSRAAAAAAAAAAAWTGAAAGARSAMAAAGSRVSTGGAALATLVSPEPTGREGGLEKNEPQRKHSVFSGRFMPLSLWAQAESTPPHSGPGSPEQKQDGKFDDEDGSSPSVAGDRTERQHSPDIEVKEAVEASENLLPTPPIAPAERNKVARGSSAPPDPCRSKTDLEADTGPPISLPRPMSADSVPDKERKSGSSTLKVPSREEGGSSPTSGRGRQGGGKPVETSRHLSPSQAVAVAMLDSKVEDELQISRMNSRSTATNTAAAETPKTKESGPDDVPDDLQPAPAAGPDERISTTRMPSSPTEDASVPAEVGPVATSRATSPTVAEPEEQRTDRPMKVRSRESQDTSHGSIESASPERRHTHFSGPCQSAQTSRSRSGSRKSCQGPMAGHEIAHDLRMSFAVEGVLSDGQREHASGGGLEADKSGSPGGDDSFSKAVDFTFAPADDLDDAAGPATTRSEEDTMAEDATQASADGWCASNSSTAVGAEIRAWRREDIVKPETASTVDSLEVNVKRVETCKEAYELDPSFPEEADPKMTPEISQTACGALEEDHPSEGLDGRARFGLGRKPRETRRQRNRNNRGAGSNYQDALDCLRLQAGLGMELAVSR